MKNAYLIIMLLMVLMLSACGSSATPTPIPTLVLENGTSPDTAKPVSSGGGIVASAVVVPAQDAHLAFVSGGNVAKVNVAAGEKVKAGQVLAELDNTIARLEVERAQRALRELASPAAIAAAEEAVASTQNDLEDAQDKVAGLNYARASDTYIDNLKGEIDLAEKRLSLASDAFRQVAKRGEGDPKRAAALVAMTNAQLSLNALNQKYEWLTGKPTETDAAIIKAKFASAQAAHQEAIWYLAALKEETIPAEASGAKLAQLQQAQNDVIVAQERLDQTILTAPFAGVVAEINMSLGDFVSPGQTMIVVSDMDHLLIETTDLSERDITQVQIGAPAVILVDALNKEFSGKVISISPVATTLGGDVVYKVTLAFDEKPEGVLGGMTADVTISAQE